MFLAISVLFFSILTSLASAKRRRAVREGSSYPAPVQGYAPKSRAGSARASQTLLEPPACEPRDPFRAYQAPATRWWSASVYSLDIKGPSHRVLNEVQQLLEVIEVIWEAEQESIHGNASQIGPSWSRDQPRRTERTDPRDALRSTSILALPCFRFCSSISILPLPWVKNKVPNEIAANFGIVSLAKRKRRA